MMNKLMKIYENHIMNMKVIFRVINTTYLEEVVKIMPEKILACAGFEIFGHQRRP